MRASQGFRCLLGMLVRAARRFGHDLVDHAQGELLRGGHAHRHGGLLGELGRAPQDARGTLRADDRVDRVLEGDDDVADGQCQRAARAALAGDHRHDRRAQAGT